MAAAALLLAADVTIHAPSIPSPHGLSLYGSGGLRDSIIIGDPAASLLPALAETPGSATAAFLKEWITKRLAVDSATGAPERAAGVSIALRSLLSSACSTSDAAAPALVARLSFMTDASLRPGTPEHTTRLAALRSAMERRKIQKPKSAVEAAAFFASLLVLEDAAWGIGAPVAD